MLAAALLIATPLSASAYGEIDDFLTGTSTREIAFSADGNTAWVTAQIAGTVSRVDVESSTPIATITVGEEPIGGREPRRE